MNLHDATPDGLIRHYFCAIEHGQDVSEPRRKVYDAVCAKCGHSDRRAQEGTWICANHRCGEPWGCKEVDMPRGAVDSAVRPGRVEDALLEVVPIGVAVNGMLRAPEWRYDMQALVGFAMTSCSVAQVAWFAREMHWPRQGRRVWTEDGTQRAISRARRELMRRLGEE